jgi:hypothetical protein
LEVAKRIRRRLEGWSEVLDSFSGGLRVPEEGGRVYPEVWVVLRRIRRFPRSVGGFVCSIRGFSWQVR